LTLDAPEGKEHPMGGEKLVKRLLDARQPLKQRGGKSKVSWRKGLSQLETPEFRANKRAGKSDVIDIDVSLTRIH